MVEIRRTEQPRELGRHVGPELVNERRHLPRRLPQLKAVIRAVARRLARNRRQRQLAEHNTAGRQRHGGHEPKASTGH